MHLITISGKDKSVIDAMSRFPHHLGVMTHNQPSHQARSPDPLTRILRPGTNSNPEPRRAYERLDVVQAFDMNSVVSPMINDVRFRCVGSHLA